MFYSIEKNNVINSVFGDITHKQTKFSVYEYIDK